MLRIVRSKNKFLLILIVAAVTVGTVSFFMAAIASPPRASCPSIDEMPFASPSLKKIIDESAVIAEGKLERVEQFGAEVKVSKVLKGSSVRNSESVGLCPTAFDLTKTEFGDGVIVFLKGKDQELWVGTWQGFSTTNVKDGRVQVGEKFYTLDEIRQAIKEQK